MSIQKLMMSYANFNLDANKQIVNWLKSQSEAKLLQEIPSSFNGILQTLNHIWAIEEIWCKDLFKNEDFVYRYGAENLESGEIFNGLISRSTFIAEKVSQLSEQDLITPLYIKTPWFEANLSLAEYLQHLFNHGTYHRGQIVTIAHNLGFTQIPSTDFLFYCITLSNKK